MSPKTKANLLNSGTTVLELAGLAAITYGLSMFSLPIALIFAGAAAIGWSYLLTRKVRR